MRLASFLTTVAPQWTALHLGAITLTERQIIVDLSSTCRTAGCPDCQRRSRRAHSRVCAPACRRAPSVGSAGGQIGRSGRADSARVGQSSALQCARCTGCRSTPRGCRARAVRGHSLVSAMRRRAAPTRSAARLCGPLVAASLRWMRQLPTYAMTCTQFCKARSVF